MSLWTNRDLANGAPKFAAFGGLGVAANGSVLFGNARIDVFKSGVALGVDGITAAEEAFTVKPQHSGWVNRKVGTGGLATIIITAGGSGYSNGFLTITGGGTSNTPANASYTVDANGVIVTTTIVTPGVYTTSPITVAVANANSQATFTGTLGGRADRVEYETLVATGSIV